MSGQSWVIHMLRLLMSWLQRRLAALVGRIGSFRDQQHDGKSSATRVQPSAQQAPELERDGASADSTQRSPETTLAAMHFPSDAAATEENAVETVADVAPAHVDDPGLTEEDMASASTATWPTGQPPAFTPDASLDLVGDIEFAFEPDPGSNAEVATDISRGWVQGDGTRECPELFPIKGNGTSRIYHLPGQASYAATIAERCFATEQDAVENGFRPTKRNRSSS